MLIQNTWDWFNVLPLEGAAAHGGGELDRDTQISRLIGVSHSSGPEQL